LGGVGTVTEVGTTRVAVAATATALVVGVVGVVLAVDDRRRAASNVSLPSPSSPTPSVAQSMQATPEPTPRVPQLAPLLLPNMRSLSASDLQIEVVGSTRRLRFAASLANVGPGPLYLLPRGRGKCPSGQHEAIQLVHRDVNLDGKFQRRPDRQLYRRVTGCMLLHSGHKHWHFDAMAAYSLRRAGSSRVLVARDKVSFCLRDNLKVPRQRVVVPRRHFRRCSRTSQQGISPGWVDLYKADLPGQWLRLPANVGSEVLCLDLEADPLRRLVETDETDNATSVAIRVDGNRVRRVTSAACL
jgi:Lysyl oxidase